MLAGWLEYTVLQTNTDQISNKREDLEKNGQTHTTTYLAYQGNAEGFIMSRNEANKCKYKKGHSP